MLDSIFVFSASKRMRTTMKRQMTPCKSDKAAAIQDESKQHLYVNGRVPIGTFASANCCRRIHDVIRQQDSTRNNESVSRHAANLIITKHRNGTTFCSRKSFCRIEAFDKTCSGRSEMKLKSHNIHIRSVCSLVGHCALLFRTDPKIPHLQKTMDAIEWRDDFVAVKNARGYVSLCCDGAVFGRYKGNVMRCSDRRCKGRIAVDNVNDIHRWSYVVNHSIVHEPDLIKRYLNKRSRVEYIKQRDLRFVPRKLRIQEVHRLDQFVTHCAASRFVDRNTPRPQNPMTLQDIDLDDPLMKFLLDRSDNNNAMIFGVPALVKKMALTDVLFMDGTFSTCCKLYAQLYIIHIKDVGTYRPVLFCLLPNKKQTTYEWLFGRIELIVKKQYETEVTVFDRDVVVKTDFERAVVGALSTKKCLVSGCFFHFAQSIYKNVRKRSWQTFKTVPDAKRLCSNLVQLAFLTPEQVSAVSSLFAAKMHACGLGAVWDSFSRTFLSRRFPPEMWCAQRLSNRTNNRCESFHSSFVKLFPSHSGRPSFGEVVNCINMSLTNTVDGTDTHPTRTLQLERENRYIETVIAKYSGCLDANDIFKCLETLAARRTNLLIDQDEIDARVGMSDIDRFEIDLESSYAENDESSMNNWM